MRNFDEVYKRIDEIYGAKFEKNRKINIIFYTISFIILIFCLIYVLKNLTTINSGLITVILIVVCTILFVMMKIKRKFECDFKYNIINELVKEYDNGLKYNIKGGINRNTFDNSGFEIKYTNIYSEDVILGRLKENINMQLGEIKLVSKRRYEDGTYESTTMFNGIFAEILLPEQVNIPKITIRRKVPTSYETKTFKKVELESSSFNEIYDFYTNSPIEALQIFTIDVVEYILEIKEKYKKNVELILKGNKICMIFNSYKPFEIRLTKKVLDYNLLKEYYEIIEMVGNIGIYFNQNINEKI